MRKIIILSLLVWVSACSSDITEKYVCPEIIIPRATTRSYQGDITDKFQINLVGHETYCYKEDADNVKASLAKLVTDGIYPNDLWEK